MQGLDPAVKALGEAGDCLHRCHRDACRRDHRRRAAGRDDLDARRVQRCGQPVKAGLVIHADDRAGNDYLAHRSDPPCSPIRTVRPPTDQPPAIIARTVSVSKTRSVTFTRSRSVSWSSSSWTGTAAWAITGPLSSPASTKNT